jgi:hypothetical protein
MSEPDRREPIDPADDRWPHEDPDVTRVVPRGTISDRPDATDEPLAGFTGESPTPEPPGGPASGPQRGFARGSYDTEDPSSGFAADPVDETPTGPNGDGNDRPAGPVTDTADGTGSPDADRAAPASHDFGGPGQGEQDPSYASVGEPTTVVPPYRGATGPDSGSLRTEYVGAPTVAYPGPASGGQPLSGGQVGYGGSPPGGYSYQQGTGPTGPGMVTGPTPAGPQFVPAPTTANVVLPPVRMPKAESRVALNALGTVVGLLLVGGGLILLLIFAPKMRTDTGALDYVNLTLTIVGAVLIALAALVTAWASWAAIVPGFLLAGVSIWAMVVEPQYGARYIADGTRWIFHDERFASFCMTGLGLTVGLLLFLAGLGAVFLRAGVRRTIRQQLDSIQA